MIGQCPECAFVLPLTKAGALPRHMPDGRRNDGGVIPSLPRCEGSGKAVTPIERQRTEAVGTQSHADSDVAWDAAMRTYLPTRVPRP